jgi:hypothetical protein
MHLPGVPVAAVAALIATLHCQAAAQAVSCEELQSRVEAKIRGNGAENFTVEVVEATSKAQGQVVGTCERGAKKLIYVKDNAAGSAASQPRLAASASAAAPAKTKPAQVITECADGRVITSGSCK